VNDANDLLGNGVVEGKLGGSDCRCVNAPSSHALAFCYTEETANDFAKRERLSVRRLFLRYFDNGSLFLSGHMKFCGFGRICCGRPRRNLAIVHQVVPKLPLDIDAHVRAEGSPRAVGDPFGRLDGVSNSGEVHAS
jgi:hypothetical protein